MKRLFFSFALLLTSYAVSAQTIVKDATGNYTAVKAAKDTTKSKGIATGKTFTDAHGKVWPVYTNSAGRVYALRTSKNGNQYKQYLDKAKN